MGIGQRLEQMVTAVDAVLPMMYPSHYAPGSYGFATPNAHPYQVIDHGLKDAQRRIARMAGAARLVPWYQAFTLGAPHYGDAAVRAQMKAGYDNGVMGWMLWNPGSRYGSGSLEPKLPSAH